MGTNKRLEEAILKTLRMEVKPAIGCTEPVALALAVAKARELADVPANEVTKITVGISPNVFKNAMGVGIPNTREAGIDMAVALGVISGESENGLEIFCHVKPEHIAPAHALIQSGIMRNYVARTDKRIYVEAYVEGPEQGDGTKKWGRAVIAYKHDNFTKLENHEGVQLDLPDVSETASNYYLEGYKVSEIIEAVEHLRCEDIAFLKDGFAMNLEMAKYGLDHDCGLMVGKKMQESDTVSDCFLKEAMTLTAAAADARMDGAPLPVMSSNGSGNNGLTSIIPIAVYCQQHDIDDERICKASAISHLTNSIIKHEIGRLSALCGCSISAGAGAAAALTWLKGGTTEQVCSTIQNMLANTSGMFCDGAKAGCALKLATSVSAAIQSSELALVGITVPCGNGIIGDTCDMTIQNIGEISKQSMKQLDDAILQVMAGQDAYE